jgi:hypothetical protein
MPQPPTNSIGCDFVAPAPQKRTPRRIRARGCLKFVASQASGLGGRCRGMNAAPPGLLKQHVTMRRADFNSQSRAVLPRTAHGFRRLRALTTIIKRPRQLLACTEALRGLPTGRICRCRRRKVRARHQLKAIPQKADIGTQSREQRDVLGSSTNRYTI